MGDYSREKNSLNDMIAQRGELSCIVIKNVMLLEGQTVVVSRGHAMEELVGIAKKLGVFFLKMVKNWRILNRN